MKKIKQFLPIIFLLLIIIPVFVGAQTTENTIIPNCSPNCGYNDLLKLVNNIIKWIIMISAPIAAGVFAWAGILYMTTGVSDKKSEAKEMLQKVFIGFVAILAAWIIVNTITTALLRGPGDTGTDFRSGVPVEGTIPAN
jgi:hypothetical protein